MAAIKNILSFLAVSVQLNKILSVVEGANVTVCAILTLVGDTTTLECNITVYMNTTNGKAGEQSVQLQVMSYVIMS